MFTPRNKGHKKILMLCLGLLIASATSCGDNKNKTNTSTLTNNNSDQQSWPSFSSAQSSLVTQAKTQLSCQSGTRLAQDITYHVTTSASASTIGGQMNSGPLSGTVSDLYIGVSAFNDLMFVSKVTNGSNVVGYNVTISMCPYQNIYMNERPITGFAAPNGISMVTQARCGFTGTLTSTNTIIQAGAATVTQNGIPVQLPAVSNVPTTFFGPNCN